MQLYGCDSVPVWHLQGKLKYLQKLSPKVINIFVKNLCPQEITVGKPPFRKKQCQYIVSLKNRIRNKFNPHHLDPDFQIFPLEQGVSHEHVIHASDNEAQVDYYLKLLGHSDGLDYLNAASENLPFKLPHSFPRPKQYSYRHIPLKKLFANIICGSDEKLKPSTQLTLISETPHYKALNKDIHIYENYVNTYRFKYLRADHYPQKLIELNTLNIERLQSLPPIIVKPLQNGAYQILDGVHRAAVYLNHDILKIHCVVIEK